MTALPEAKLAREAEICYAVIACVSDYDSWHEHKEPVTLDVVLDRRRYATLLSPASATMIAGTSIKSRLP